MTTQTFISSFVQRIRSSFRPDPTRDWLMLVSLALIALAGIIVWNAWAFDTVASGGTIGSVSSTQAPVFSQASLGAIRTVFSDRATEEAKYVSGAYYFADPSQ